MTAPGPTAQEMSARDLAKGAWGGAWTAVWGCVEVLRAVAVLGAHAAAVEAVRWGAAELRAEALKEESADGARRLADLLARAPEALGGPLRPWIAAAGAIGVTLIVAGRGVARRSGTARRVAIAGLAASALVAAGSAVHEMTVTLPAEAAWFAEVRAVLDDARRGGGASSPLVDVLLGRDLGAQRTAAAAWLVVHLSLTAAIVARLAGPRTRAWCAPRVAAAAGPAGARAGDAPGALGGPAAPD